MAVVKIGDLGAAASKLQQNGQSGAKAYVTNAVASANAWHENTAASEDNYRTGVQDALNRGAFGKGVQKAGAGAYSQGIQLSGGGRFTDGMSKAGPAWQRGFGPIAAAVQGKDIGPRGPVGSQQNKARSSAMQDAFRAARLGAA